MGNSTIRSLPRWEELPDFDLYMDQVLSLMERYLGDDGKALTASMINNYVKMGAVPPPCKKRYSRSHLVRILVICVLKNVLPLGEIQKLLSYAMAASSEDVFYNSFCTQYESSAAEVAAIWESQDRSSALPMLRAALRAQAERQQLMLLCKEL